MNPLRGEPLADIVGAKCPGCGAPVNFPEGMESCYCRYCGCQAIKPRVETHIHVHEGTGSVENYYALGKKAFDAMDLEGAIANLEKAQAIDMNVPHVNDLLKQAYIAMATRLFNEADEKERRLGTLGGLNL
jgi:hypothetical protein